MTDEPHPQYTSSPQQWEKLKLLAQQMRHAPTPAEDILWQRIRRRRVGGAKFRRQHAVEGFIVDFVCIECSLIVEIDGSVHDQIDQKRYDEQRQALLESRGFRVLRFANADVIDSLEEVVSRITEALDKPHPNPSP